jgi:hypothetical protein
MQLHTLQIIDGLGPSASNTLVMAVPLGIIELVKKAGDRIQANGMIPTLSRG